MDTTEEINKMKKNTRPRTQDLGHILFTLTCSLDSVHTLCVFMACANSRISLLLFFFSPAVDPVGFAGARVNTGAKS